MKEPPIGPARPVAGPCRNAREAAVAGLPSPQYVGDTTDDIPAALQRPELADALADILRPYAAAQKTAAAEAGGGPAEDATTKEIRLANVAMASARAGITLARAEIALSQQYRAQSAAALGDEVCSPPREGRRAATHRRKMPKETTAATTTAAATQETTHTHTHMRCLPDFISPYRPSSVCRCHPPTQLPAPLLPTAPAPAVPPSSRPPFRLMIPESYLTALVQATCRKYKWPLDKSSIFTRYPTHPGY